MSAIDTLMGQPAAQAIGWALVHFVWQGTLVAILTAAALALLRTSAADVRYVVTTIALTLMFTLPAVTVTQMWTTNAGLEVGTTATAQRGLIAGATATTAASFRRSTIENSAPPRGLSRVLSFGGAGLQRRAQRIGRGVERRRTDGGENRKRGAAA